MIQKIIGFSELWCEPLMVRLCAWTAELFCRHMLKCVTNEYDAETNMSLAQKGDVD